MTYWLTHTHTHIYIRIFGKRFFNEIVVIKYPITFDKISRFVTIESYLDIFISLKDDLFVLEFRNHGRVSLYLVSARSLFLLCVFQG